MMEVKEDIVVGKDTLASLDEEMVDAEHKEGTDDCSRENPVENIQSIEEKSGEDSHSSENTISTEKAEFLETSTQLNFMEHDSKDKLLPDKAKVDGISQEGTFDSVVVENKCDQIETEKEKKQESVEEKDAATYANEPVIDKESPIEVRALNESIKDEIEPMNEEIKNEDYPVDSDGVVNHSFQFFTHADEGEESGTEEEQSAFIKELENFFRERNLEFKVPKFYGEGLNCLKLWRAVIRLGGYDRVTTSKLWRQVGESFKPPKTCTTVSWSFRIFYEKALLDYEKHKISGGELQVPVPSITEPMAIENQVGENQTSGSGRARRDAAARAMQGWHSQRFLGNGDVGDPIVKDKSPISLPKREKQLKNIGVLKRKKPSSIDRVVKVTHTKGSKSQMDTMVVDIGPPADWVKINVRKTKDCYEVYALVPGLLREEVRVQSDPAGRLVISGEPEQPDNPWGVTPFKKVITLPSRIDPHQTSAVVTLHGQLFVRVPFELSET